MRNVLSIVALLALAPQVAAAPLTEAFQSEVLSLLKPITDLDAPDDELRSVFSSPIVDSLVAYKAGRTGREPVAETAMQVGLRLLNLADPRLVDVRVAPNGRIARVVGTVSVANYVTPLTPSELRLRLVKEGEKWKIDKIDLGAAGDKIKTCQTTEFEPPTAYRREGLTYYFGLSGRIVRVETNERHTLVILRNFHGDWCVSFPPGSALAAAGMPIEEFQVYRELVVAVRRHTFDDFKVLIVPAVPGP